MKQVTYRNETLKVNEENFNKDNISHLEAVNNASLEIYTNLSNKFFQERKYNVNDIKNFFGLDASFAIDNRTTKDQSKFQAALRTAIESRIQNLKAQQAKAALAVVDPQVEAAAQPLVDPQVEAAAKQQVEAAPVDQQQNQLGGVEVIQQPAVVDPQVEAAPVDQEAKAAIDAIVEAYNAAVVKSEGEALLISQSFKPSSAALVQVKGDKNKAPTDDQKAANFAKQLKASLNNSEAFDENKAKEAFHAMRRFYGGKKIDESEKDNPKVFQDPTFGEKVKACLLMVLKIATFGLAAIPEATTSTRANKVTAQGYAKHVQTQKAQQAPVREMA